MSAPGSLPPAYFTAFWGEHDDPWGLESSWYEDRKRAVVLAALPEPRYRRAFEPGCAGGALSALLAERCDALLCTDVAEAAVERAGRRLAGHPHVEVARRAVPDDLPDGPFDLVVVSEVAYYLDTDDRARLWERLVAALEPGGTLLAVHWVRAAPEYPATGHRVHDELAAVDGLGHLLAHREEDFRLDVHVRVPPPVRSVAERTGLR